MLLEPFLVPKNMINGYAAADSVKNGNIKTVLFVFDTSLCKTVKSCKEFGYEYGPGQHGRLNCPIVTTGK